MSAIPAGDQTESIPSRCRPTRPAPAVASERPQRRFSICVPPCRTCNGSRNNGNCINHGGGLRRHRTRTQPRWPLHLHSPPSPARPPGAEPPAWTLASLSGTRQARTLGRRPVPVPAAVKSTQPLRACGVAAETVKGCPSPRQLCSGVLAHLARLPGCLDGSIECHRRRLARDEWAVDAPAVRQRPAREGQTRVAVPCRPLHRVLHAGVVVVGARPQPSSSR
jgi:hypothetical protein